jgi:hypothetical protein
MNHNKLYIVFVTVAFSMFAIVFLAFPRSEYSELEKRELATFPEYTFDKLTDNTLTGEISTWFSDSEPFRDDFMSMSMEARDMLRMTIDGDEAVTVHGGAEQPGTTDSEAPGPDATDAEIEEYKNNITANENAKLANAGIIIIGNPPTVRALMAYGGSANGGEAYAKAVNEYKEALGNVNVYSMVIPLATEFYFPDKAKKATKPQLPTIKHIYSKLTGGAHGVDAYSALAAHVKEDIYLRTDHHWAPLGAFYAAQAFAKYAKVPFKGLSSYTRHEIKNYVGTMYGYSKDASVKKSPETFVYYTPNGVEYSTTYVNYNVNKSFKITGVGKPYSGPFFYKFKDGSSAAYCTFMGSDMKLTKVKTSTKNGRRVLIIKDSYGNAVPGYLFYSFEEVHVVDFRYFTQNIKKYVKENRITDLVFVTNVFNAYAQSTYKKLHQFLVQGDGANIVSENEFHNDSTTHRGDVVASKPTETKTEVRKAEPTAPQEPETPREEPAAPASPATPEEEI